MYRIACLIFFGIFVLIGLKFHAQLDIPSVVAHLVHRLCLVVSFTCAAAMLVELYFYKKGTYKN